MKSRKVQYLIIDSGLILLMAILGGMDGGRLASALVR